MPERRICIDPGHGGSDPGAVGEGIAEAETVLEVAKLTAAAIRSAGLPTGMTRVSDVTLAPPARIRSIVAPANLCVVSIHANSAGTPLARGYEVFVSAFDKRSRRLGEEIAAGLGALTPLPPRDPPVKTRLSTDWRGDWYYVVNEPRKAGIPSVLVECGFVSNPQDAAYLAGFWGRFQLAHAISRGVLAWAGLDVAGLQDCLDKVSGLISGEGR